MVGNPKKFVASVMIACQIGNESKMFRKKNFSFVYFINIPD